MVAQRQTKKQRELFPRLPAPNLLHETNMEARLAQLEQYLWSNMQNVFLGALLRGAYPDEILAGMYVAMTRVLYKFNDDVRAQACLRVAQEYHYRAYEKPEVV